VLTGARGPSLHPPLESANVATPNCPPEEPQSRDLTGVFLLNCPTNCHKNFGQVGRFTRTVRVLGSSLLPAA
jgi:hypothetical protein